MLIDIHFHPDYYNAKELKRLECKNLICVANSLSSKNHEKIINIAKEKHCYFALGVYPEFASYDELLILKGYVEKFKPIAIGEVGLDKTYNNFELQIEIFKEIMKLSKTYDLPLIVHSRKAEQEVVELLFEYKPKVILHYFNGKFKLAIKLVKNNFLLTIPSNVVRNAHFQKFVKELPLNSFLPETDAPFLHPFRKWPNYPENVKFAYEFVAKTKNMSLDEVELIFLKNFQGFFRINTKNKTMN